MFAAIIVGALLGGGSRSTPLPARPVTGRRGPPAAQQPALVPGVGQDREVAVRKTISATARLACTAGQAARFTSLTGNEQAVLPVPRALATAASSPGAC